MSSSGRHADQPNTETRRSATPDVFADGFDDVFDADELKLVSRMAAVACGRTTASVALSSGDRVWWDGSWRDTVPADLVRLASVAVVLSNVADSSAALAAAPAGHLSVDLFERRHAQPTASADVAALPCQALLRLVADLLRARLMARSLEQRVHQRSAELHEALSALRDSEARLRLAAQASGTGLWDWNLLTNEVYYSPEWKRQLGYADAELRNHWDEFESRLHPDDHDQLLQKAQRYIAAPEGDYEAEFRLRHRDGSYRWIFVRGAVHHDTDARPIRMLGSHVDLTDRKETELELARSREALHRLSGDLLRTRERERSEVAREIHDELGQALTALKLDVAWLGRHAGAASATDLNARLQGLSAALDEAVQTVRRIAAELRPRLLDDLGLGAALEWQAEHFQLRTDVACRCEVRLPAQPPPDIATALFRIAQESLTNVARHARAAQVVVRLAQRDQAWHLTIADDGVGMTPDAMGSGIGLTGMRERAHLVGGSLTIDSAPGQGTTVHARVPCLPAAADDHQGIPS